MARRGQSVFTASWPGSVHCEETVQMYGASRLGKADSSSGTSVIAPRRYSKSTEDRREGMSSAIPANSSASFGESSAR